MKARTKGVLFLFLLVLGTLVGGLFHPLYQHGQAVKRLALLSIKRQAEEQRYVQLLQSQKIHRLNTERISIMEQQGFFNKVDEKEVLEKIHALVRLHKIHVTALQIGEPVKESAESWSTLHWSVQLEFSGNSEENIDRIIESFQKDLPGLVIPTDLRIVQKKRHAFWVKYGFWISQGISSLKHLHEPHLERGVVIP